MHNVNMPTMKDVAKRATVSAKTVSRVFRDDPMVAPETRSRVKKAMRELGYQPNMLARTFREGKDTAIGIAVPDIGDPFFATVVRVVEELALARGMAVIVTSLGQDAARERRGIESLLHRQVSGILIAPVSADQGYLADWQVRTPIVFFDREATGLQVDSLIADDEADACAATEHLLERGHTRIAFMGDTTTLVTTALRRRGYFRALAQAGIPHDEALVALNPSLLTYGYATVNNAVADVQRLLEQDDPPTAIFSSNARCSMGVAEALHKIGRTDIAFLSFGDFPMASALSPGISVIDQDPGGLARLACEALFARLDEHTDRSAAASVLRRIIPLRLIERGSGELSPPSG